MFLFVIPSCRQCKFYKENLYNFDDLSKCKIFNITFNKNQTYYENAESCRKNENKCGIYGKKYIKNDI